MSRSPNNRIRYEFDKSGENPDNLVANESHVLHDREKRILQPRHAHFYINSVVITDKATGSVVPRSSYFFDDFSQEVAELTGKGAAGYIVIADSTVSKNVTVTYQAVGGQFTNADVVQLQRNLANLNLDNRPVTWKNIANKPTAFPPTPHLHPIWQTHSYGHLIYAIERLKQAILIGDENSHNSIWDAINDLNHRLANHSGNGTDTQLTERFNRFVEDTNNRLAAIGDQSRLLTRLNELSESIKAHVEATGNVHRLTLDDLDVYSRSQTEAKINTAISGLKNTMGNDVSGLNDKLSQLESKYNQLNNNQNALKTRVDTDYYTKSEANRLYETGHGYTDTRETIARLAMVKYLFDGFKVPTAKLIGKDGVAFTVTEQTIDTYNREHLGNINTRMKLSEKVVPISTEKYNQLRWNKDGLYYGSEPDAVTGNLYVDPVEGVDEAVTFENKRGTKEKPLATLAFALTQGPDSITRNIYLKEGLEHFVGREIVDTGEWYSSESRTINFKPNKPNHSQLHNATVRGGTVNIGIYGPRFDAILEEIKSFAINDKLAEQPYHKRVIDIGTKLTFRCLNLGSILEVEGQRKQSITMYGLTLLQNPTVNFSYMTIQYGVVPSASAMRSIKDEEVFVSSSYVIGWNVNANISFKTCSFHTGSAIELPPKSVNTGTGQQTTQSKLIIPYFTLPNGGIQNFNFHFSNVKAENFKGTGAFADLRSASGSSIKFSQDYDEALITSSSHEDGVTYFDNMKQRNGLYISVTTNLIPSLKEYLGQQKEGAPRGHREALLEYDSNKDAFFAVYHDGVNVRRKQISPAIWG